MSWNPSARAGLSRRGRRRSRSKPSSFPAPAISAASRSPARCPLRSGRWSGRSSFSTRWARRNSLTGQGVDVRPHPHIGLATVTYLYRGEFQHRDSLGSNQVILPGAVNWMVAGRGVTHSERTSAETSPRAARPVRRAGSSRVALPAANRGIRRRVSSITAAQALPTALRRRRGSGCGLFLESAYGEARAGPRVLRDLLCRRRARAPSRSLPLPDDHEDRGALHRRGRDHGRRADVRSRADAGVPAQAIAISVGAGAKRRAPACCSAARRSSGPRYIWWNFVASRTARGSTRRKEEWRKGGLGQRPVRPAARRSRRIHPPAVLDPALLPSLLCSEVIQGWVGLSAVTY